MSTWITVRGFHVDVYGHVNNARYLEFLEEARWDQLGRHGNLAWWQRQGYAFVIANINVNFLHPATMDDRLAISVALSDLGERSGTVHQRIVREDGTEVANAEVTFVILNHATGHSEPLTGELRQRLEAMAAGLARE